MTFLIFFCGNGVFLFGESCYRHASRFEYCIIVFQDNQTVPNGNEHVFRPQAAHFGEAYPVSDCVGSQTNRILTEHPA